MLVGKVIGNIWSTRKEESLRGLKFLVVCPLNLLEGEKPGQPIVAVDSIGAGIGGNRADCQRQLCAYRAGTLGYSG